MNSKSVRFAAFFVVITTVACFLALTAATYAWFTSNDTVSTSRVEGRTGTADVSLQISSRGGDQFRGSDSAELVQINSADTNELLPVTTADLKSFLYNPMTMEGNATRFLPVEGEAGYYHGRIYLRAVAQGQLPGNKLALYLDESASAGGVLTQKDEGLLKNASRLGLTFGEGQQSPVIFYLSEENNASQDQVRNTVLNGVTVADGNVLTEQNGVVTAVKDPAVSLKDYTINTDAASAGFPPKTLFVMELNRIYPVDVYFYLEGCDPDCSDSVSYDALDLHLAFFGVLQ